MMLSSRPLENVVTIQILRGLAAWAVVFAHFMQVFYAFQSTHILGHFFSHYGGLGVDIFFIISGFVMYLTVSAKAYTAGSFLKNRIIRIVPAYWLATAFLVMLSLVGAITHNYELALWNIPNLVKSLLFIPHEHLSGIGYYPVLTVGWTLVFEMFFYCSLAICLLIARKLALPLVILVMLILPIISDPSWPMANILNSRLLYEFVIGIILGFLFQYGFPLIKNDKISALCGCLILALGVAYFIFSGPYERYLGCALLVTGALFCEGIFRNAQNIFKTVMLWLGALSYSAYLYHPLVLFTLFSNFGTPQDITGVLIMLVATIVLTIICSHISYMFIEQRMARALKEKMRFGGPTIKAPQ